MTSCKFCGKPIVLVPSAQERAKSTGLPASNFTKMFQWHSECLVEYRNREASAFIKRLKESS